MEIRDSVMSKIYKWNGRIVVTNKDFCPNTGEYIQQCIDYYNDNDQWQHCLTTHGRPVKWVSYYEILKTGTMKIHIYKEVL